MVFRYVQHSNTCLHQTSRKAYSIFWFSWNLLPTLNLENLLLSLYQLRPSRLCSSTMKVTYSFELKIYKKGLSHRNVERQSHRHKFEMFTVLDGVSIRTDLIYIEF